MSVHTVLVMWIVLLSLCCSVYGTNTPKNVVFIILDDFRPAIKAAGDTTAYTPNLDKLVKSSYYFENCFAQVGGKGKNQFPELH